MSKNVNITLHKDVSYLLSRLENAGFEAYAVGGFVRDAILGREAGDCDITTSALPEEIKTVFSDLRTIDTGIKHGTVTVLYGGTPYEITTYRVDGEYADNRHPDTVTFTASLREDLARRDFTVNAMAYSDSRGLVDAFCGREDLADRLIRAVGEPERRFSEDALRILRALRFASVLDFEIDEATRIAIFSESYRLASVSAERILVELRKLIGGVGAYRIIREYERILLPLLRGITEIRLPDPTAFSNMTSEERMIALFYLSAENPAVSFSDTMLALRTDRHTERFGTAVLSVMSSDLSGDRLCEATLDFGREVVSSALTVLSHLSIESDAHDRFAELIESGAPTSIAELAIGGKELISIGYSGTDIGILLRKLTIAAMSGKVENTSDSLIEYINKAPLA